MLGFLGYPTSPEQVVQRIEQLRAGGSAVALLAEIDHAPAGLITAHALHVLHNDAPVVQLTALVVVPAHRGKGVGGALVGAIEAWARARGSKRLVVTTALHRAEAPQFYRRLAFEHTGRRFAKAL